jgi:hypothetical protein
MKKVTVLKNFESIKKCVGFMTQIIAINCHVRIKHYMNWAWWYIPVILVLRRQRQEDDLGCIMIPCL